MSEGSAGFKSFCKGGHDQKCDMHFVIENEVLSNRERAEKMEEQTRKSFSEFQKTLSDFIVEVRSYMGVQKHRDSDHQEVKALSNKNTSDIVDLKLAVKTISDNSTHMSNAVTGINNSIKNLTETIQVIDKKILDKSAVETIAHTAIITEKSTKQDKWFESLPAKVSATVAVISFVAFFTIKIVLALLAASQ